MHDISLFPEIFSETAVKDTTAMIKARLGQGAKKGKVLDIIASANHFKDYKTAKGLYDKYLYTESRVWIPEGTDDQDMCMVSSLADLDLLDIYADDLLLEFDFAYDFSGDGDCYTKKELIALMKQHGVVLFRYEVSGSGGGNPCFTVIIPDNMAKIEAFIAAVYRVTVPEIDELFGSALCEGDLVSDYVRRYKALTRY